jgi:endoglucanase
MKNKQVVKIKSAVLLSALMLPCVGASAQIRVNQVGMNPQQEKVATIEGLADVSHVKIVDAKGKTVDVQPKMLRIAKSPWSDKERTVVDFSELKQPGRYMLKYGKQTSPAFTIQENALEDVTKAAIKAFYLIRSGMPIEKQYAGKFARPLGHPDTKVLVHPSAVSEGRPAGTVISSPGGWYDAGDYNKYIVNSAFSIGIMLGSYEMNKARFDAIKLNIPESNNRTTDLLDELMYNLKWMLTMQDPADGGVYHKLTTPNFEGFIMPTDCKQQRYVVQKSTTATLDFAAVMAQAARIYRQNADYPDFARQAEEAAKNAYEWAKQHPRQFYEQDRMNKEFQPAVSTGTYGDGNADDEWFWAATELYFLTKDGQYADVAKQYQPRYVGTPTWGMVSTLGVFDWLTHEANAEMSKQFRTQLLAFCDRILATTATSCFQTPSGNSPRDYAWGCLAEKFCGDGVMLLYAHQLTKDKKYMKGALQNVEYVLGRNATGYCYVTGFGTKRVMHPHHRVSEADGIAEPMPGLLAGGPNPGQQDLGSGLKYPSKQPDESFIDDMGSYASNEIAINWNATLVALLGGVE